MYAFVRVAKTNNCRPSYLPRNPMRVSLLSNKRTSSYRIPFCPDARATLEEEAVEEEVVRALAEGGD